MERQKIVHRNQLKRRLFSSILVGVKSDHTMWSWGYLEWRIYREMEEHLYLCIIGPNITRRGTRLSFLAFVYVGVSDLYLSSLASNYDVIGITETWLHCGIYSYELLHSAFRVYRKDRNYEALGVGKGGGRGDVSTTI